MKRDGFHVVKVKVPRGYLQFLRDYLKVIGWDLQEYLERAITSDIEAEIDNISDIDLNYLARRYGIKIH